MLIKSRSNDPVQVPEALSPGERDLHGSLRFFLSALSLAAVCVLGSCSSLPTQTAEPVQMGIKAQAADQNRLGDENMSNRNYPLAEDYYRRSFEYNARVDNLEGMCQARNALGFLYLSLGKSSDAQGAYKEALEIAQVLKDKSLEALSWTNLAKAALALKDYPRALDCLDQAQEADGKSPKLQAVILHNRAAIFKETGKADQALSLLNEAKGINQGLGLLRETASNQYLMASILNQQGKRDEALSLLEQTLDLDKKAEASDAICGDLFALARVCQGRNAQGDLERSRDYAWRAFQSALAEGDSVIVRRSLELLVTLDTALKHPDDVSRWNAYLGKLNASAPDANSAAGTNKETK